MSNVVPITNYMEKSLVEKISIKPEWKISLIKNHEMIHSNQRTKTNFKYLIKNL